MSEMLRSPREADIATVVGLMSQDWPDPIDAQSVLRAWTSPGIDRERDVRLGPGCYAIIQGLDHERVWLDVRGHLSGELLDWAEARAAEKGRRFFAGAWSNNERTLAALAARGFGSVRYSHRMEIDLGEPTPEPRWPEGVDVRTFRSGDERVFYEVHQETFRDSWEPIEETYDEWAHALLEPPAFAPDLWFLALAGDEPAGFALCHPHSGNDKLGWVRILGVRRPWRRRGLGRALLLHAFSEFRQRGFRLAGLGVDAESLTGANRLYEQVGMRVSARFDIYEKTVG